MGGEPKPNRIGPYDVVRRLEGSGRESYLARRPGGPTTPILLIAFELRPEDAKLVQQEVERCKLLDHPAIARVLELFAHEGRHVLACENPVGVPLSALLANLLAQREPMADRAAFHLGHMLFGALASAHSATAGESRVVPVVHGQLRPNQIFVSRAGAVQISGFGLSRVFRLAHGVEDEPAEARPYVAPEQHKGSGASMRSNVYSAAAMLWALLARRAPDDTGERLPSLAGLRPDLPADITGAIDRGLEPAVVKRSVTSRELAAVFEQHAGDAGKSELGWNAEVLETPEAREEGVPPPASFPPRKLSEAPEPAPEPAPPSESDEPTGQYRLRNREGLRKLLKESLRIDRSAEAQATPRPAGRVPRPATPPPPPRTRADTATPGVSAAPDSTPPPISAEPVSFAQPAGPTATDEEAPISVAAPISIAAPISLAPPSQGTPSLRPRALRARARLRSAGASLPPMSARQSLPPAYPETTAGLPRISVRPRPPVDGAIGDVPGSNGSLSPLSAATAAKPKKLAEARRGRWRARLSSAGVPTKLLVAFALTAVASFAAGLIVASGPVQVSVGAGPKPPASAAATARPDPRAELASANGSCSPPAEQPSAPSSAAVAAAAPPGEARAADDNAAARPVDDGDDGSRLPADLGYLLVSSPQVDAQVYVSGDPVGSVGKKLLVRCGLINVRLGTVPLDVWYGEGRPVSVACQGVTSLNMDHAKATRSGPTAASPAAKARAAKSNKYWAPDDI